MKQRSLAAIKAEFPGQHVFRLTTSEPGQRATVWSFDGPLSKGQYDELVAFVLKLVSPQRVAGVEVPGSRLRSVPSGKADE